jgi:hydrogenase maturation protease
MNMATIVIGIGNAVRTDDAVGLHAVRAIAARTRGRADVATQELHTGGIRLMEAMTGYRKAILIDATETQGGTPGTIRTVPAAGLLWTRNTHSMHDTSLPVALAFGSAAGLELPSEITVWTVEAEDIENFGETLTPAVRAALPRVVEQVMRQLDGDPSRSGPA